ncbi:MAG: orotidine-5'-phosphate decarboxylase [Acidimicrobiales bacterium]
MFAERVAEAVGRTGPLCAGIDPSPELLAGWGLPDDAGGLRRFALTCVEAFAGAVPVVKPQVAFFERQGAAGMAVLEELIAEAGRSGLLVIGDAKRGDIGSTVEAYADAWLGGGSPLAVDAVTALPYMGLGSLRPMVEAARRHGRGVIVVVRGSNPEGRPLQEAVTASGAAVEDLLLEGIARWNEEAPGAVGAVVGATLVPSRFPLSQLNGVILAPGVGAQGAGPAEVAERFGGCPAGAVLPSASRSVLAAGPDPAALRDAAVQATGAMAAVLS